MARVPVVDSPCPIQGKQLPAGATEHCSLCERSVHNLDRMNERERRDFMSACDGKVCVAYTVRLPVKLPVRRRGLAAATMAAAAMVSLPAAADADGAVEVPAGPMSPLPGAEKLPNCDEYFDYIIVGGVSRGRKAGWVEDGKDAPPELPVIEDDGR